MSSISRTVGIQNQLKLVGVVDDYASVKSYFPESYCRCNGLY
jgi:hypothetical protein